MGLRSDIRSDLAAAFDTDLADAVSTFTGTYMGAGVWDPVNETTTAQPVTYTGRGVLSRYKKDQVDGVNILATDVRLIALVNEVTDKPAPEHIVSAPDLITGQAKQYRVMEAVTDPVGVHYQIQLRAT